MKTCIQKRKWDTNKLLFKNKCPKALKSRQMFGQNVLVHFKQFRRALPWRSLTFGNWFGINSVFGIKDSLHCGLEHWIVYGEGGEPFFVEHFGLGTPPDKGKCSLNVTKRPLTGPLNINNEAWSWTAGICEQLVERMWVNCGLFCKSDIRFVKKFTRLDFWAQNFTH